MMMKAPISAYPITENQIIFDSGPRPGVCRPRRAYLIDDNMLKINDQGDWLILASPDTVGEYLAWVDDDNNGGNNNYDN